MESLKEFVRGIIRFSFVLFVVIFYIIITLITIMVSFKTVSGSSDWFLIGALIIIALFYALHFWNYFTLCLIDNYKKDMAIFEGCSLRKYRIKNPISLVLGFFDQILSFFDWREDHRNKLYQKISIKNSVESQILEVVKKYKGVLLEKRAALVKVDDYGDLSHSEWIEEIAKFYLLKVRPNIDFEGVDISCERMIELVEDEVKNDSEVIIVNSSDFEKFNDILNTKKTESGKLFSDSRVLSFNPKKYIYILSVFLILGYFMPLVEIISGETYRFSTVDVDTRGILYLVLVVLIILFNYKDKLRYVYYTAGIAIAHVIFVHVSLANRMSAFDNSDFGKIIPSSVAFEYSWGWIFLYGVLIAIMAIYLVNINIKRNLN